MKIAYGYYGVDEDEDLYATALEANTIFNETAVVGVWLVDQIPFCKSACRALNYRR